MQPIMKRLIAGAIFFTPILAWADTPNVSVYGQANVSYDITNNGVVGANKVSSNVSRIGLKGAEEMGGGLSVIWQIESQINLDGTAGGTQNTFATRNSYAGLSSESMGRLILGRHDTPYKLATRDMDQFSNDIADNRSLMGVTRNRLGTASFNHDARTTNTVLYISPVRNGFKAAVAYIANAEGVTTATDKKGSAWSVAGIYGDAGMNASLAYQTITAGTAGGAAAGVAAVAPNNVLAAGDKAAAWKIGAGYTMDAVKVNVVYEKTSTTAVAGNSDQRNIYLSGKYSFGNDAVKLAYTLAGKNTGAAASDAKQLSMGYDHNLSKRTSVYALYTQVRNGTAANYGLTGANTTGAVSAVAGTTGLKPMAWSFGMRHSF